LKSVKQSVQADPDKNPEHQSDQRHELSVNANLPGRQSFDWRETPTSWSFWRHRDDPSASDEKQQPFAGEEAKQLRKALQNGKKELTHDPPVSVRPPSYIGKHHLVFNSPNRIPAAFA
jgi:hypothetical protein